MKTALVITVVVCIAATAFTFIPGIKGPINRVKNNVNEKLNEEYLVDNYKAEYVKLAQQHADIQKKIIDFKGKKAYNEKKLQDATKAEQLAKTELLATGTSDMRKFRTSKDVYESAKLNADNFRTLVKTYADGLVKLECTLALVETNMSKAKSNVDMLSSKKTLVDTVKDINKTLENIKGIGDPSIGVSLEKLEEDRIKEEIKLQVLDDTARPSALLTKAQAEEYLKTLQPAKSK